MAWLGYRLDRAGHRSSRFGYTVMRDDLDAVVTRFVAHIDRVLETDRAASAGSVDAPESPRYAVVGHSLGNIITRAAVDRLPPGLTRLVMLAPPNQSPALARRLKDNGLFRFATGDAGQKLASAEFYASLATPAVPTLVLAGTLGAAWWLDGPSDGVVKVDETVLEGATHQTVHAVHTFIMNHPEATRAIVEFLTVDDPTDTPRA